jgi:hypothetical protein
VTAAVDQMQAVFDEALKATQAEVRNALQEFNRR